MRVAVVWAETGTVNSDPIMRCSSSIGRFVASTAMFSKEPRSKRLARGG